MIRPISKSAAGLDVHKAVVVCTLIQEQSNGCLSKESREYKAFNADLLNLAKWLKTEEVQTVAMESTGIYWKKVYEAIEDIGVKSDVVNARHIKNVPGRKTDISDSEWIAELARCGLLKPSFIPPKDISSTLAKNITVMLRSIVHPIWFRKNHHRNYSSHHFDLTSYNF